MLNVCLDSSSTYGDHPIIERQVERLIRDIQTITTKPKIIWMTFNEFGELETEFIYPEKEKNQMPYACEKDLMYNKNKSAKRFICFEITEKGASDAN